MTNSPVLDTIRDSFGRVVYTHKTHEKQIEVLGQALTLHKWLQLGSIALTGAGTLSIIIGQNRACEVATAVLAAISLALTVYGWSFDPEKAMSQHRQCARQLWHIRERYLNLIADLTEKRITDDVAAGIRDSLVEQLAIIYQSAPDTSSKAYKKACTALRVSEEMTFSDEEIDAFLPKTLRKVASKQ